MNLIYKVLQTINKHQLIKSSDTVIVGVSGGADSVALLHILYQWRHQLGIKLHVAHLNHRLRASADKDEAFVKALAHQLRLPITVSRRSKPSKPALVSEDTARQWRFEFFRKLALKTGAQSVALAHTQNDLAETVLMRLLRGSGLLGLRGILSENYLQETRVIRPLLSVQRAQIEAYLKSQNLEFRADETNAQTHYLRNKIRLKLLPALIKDYNNNLPNVLVDLALTAGDDYDYILNQAQQFFKKHAKATENKVSIGLDLYLHAPKAIGRMFLRLAFEHLVSDFLQLSFSHIKEVDDMLSSGPPGSIVHWPRSVKVGFTKKMLVLSLQIS